MSMENIEAAFEASISDELDALVGPEEEEQDDGSFEDGEAPEDDGEPVEGDEEAEDGDDEEGADDAPPVDAPHSWSKEDKEVFAALPREAQDVIARREKERDSFVNAKAREAADTRRVVETEARDVIGKMYENHIQQLQVFAAQVLPQSPDKRLLYSTNPDEVNLYHRQQAAYQDAQDQQRELHQELARSQAAQRAALEQSQQAEIQADAQRLRDELPEWFNPETGPALQRELQAIGSELGYSPELMNEASSGDILALKRAAEWKAKAEKYDALQGKKMEAVRAAKGLPKMATPGVKPSKRQMNAANSQKAWERVKASNAKDGNAIADWMGIQ